VSLKSTVAGQVLEVAAGAAADLPNDAFTAGILLKGDAGISNIDAWSAYTPANTTIRGLFLFQGDMWGVGNGGGMATVGLLTTKWYWLVITKAPGTGIWLRFHWAELTAAGALVWTHVDATHAPGTFSLIPSADVDRICFGDPFGTGFAGELAAFASWNTELDDATIEATFARTASAITDAAPSLFVTLPEATAADPLPGEISRTTSWAASADPAGFDFGLVTNQNPTVDAGPSQIVNAGDTVIVTATANDPDGTVDDYDWVRLSGPDVVLTGAGASRQFVAPDVEGTVVLQVTVIDNEGATAQDTVAIDIAASPPGPDPAYTLQLNTQRRLTKAFIDRAPVTLTMTPRSREKTLSGGSRWVDGGAPRAPQVMTLIELGTVGGQPEPTRTVDGVERRVEFELLAEFNAQLARFDTFTHQGKSWEIIDLFYDNGYEIRAMVSARG